MAVKKTRASTVEFNPYTQAARRLRQASKIIREGGSLPIHESRGLRALARGILGHLDNHLGIIPLSPQDLVPPYIIKTVQYTSSVTEADRAAELRYTGNNVFCVKAGTIFLDFLTDSGTGAQSDRQWAEIMGADERYSHSVTFEQFVPTVQQVFGKEFVLPVHQGRAAENIAFTVLLQHLMEKARSENKQIVCIGNTYFDTTHGNTARQGAQVRTANCPECNETEKYFPFKGNADVDKLAEIIKEVGPENIGFMVMTVVNNTVGGQPVSLKNLKAAHALAKQHGILLILDAARIFENAYFIKVREEEYKDKSIQEIVLEMTRLADVVLMSCKKDAIANMGGLIATSDRDLYKMFETYCILIEGHYSYGGMSGRDLAALKQGLIEGSEFEYLRSRINQVTELGNGFRRLGLPIQWPPGSNGVFLDGRKFLDHVNHLFFPAQRICAEIYRRYGIRPVEIGLSLAGRGADGKRIIPDLDLVRFTVPRRVYTGEHMAFVLSALETLYQDRGNIGGLMFDKEGMGNGHFTSTFKLVSPGEIPQLLPEVERYFSAPLRVYDQSYLPPNARG
ncbi:MAG: tryptophanase [Candidatus Margulisiibacteriota bacterium]